ncbi:MAG: hypothetical protein V7721_10665 [Porticoccaceae bacterium]
MTLNNEALENIHNWEAINPMHKLSAFKYDEADYQLTPGLISENPTVYLEFLEIAFPDNEIA